MAELTSREKFLKVYASLPIPVRDEVIYVDSSQGPMSWKVSYLEVDHNTELGQKILKWLEEFNLI